MGSACSKGGREGGREGGRDAVLPFFHLLLVGGRDIGRGGVSGGRGHVQVVVRKEGAQVGCKGGGGLERWVGGWVGGRERGRGRVRIFVCIWGAEVDNTRHTFCSPSIPPSFPPSLPCPLTSGLAMSET